MTLDHLAAHVGADRFRRACDAAWASAARTGQQVADRPGWDADLADVPHELADLTDGDLDLTIALYRAMPCYANLMYVGALEQDPRFWVELRSLLDDPDDRLADPVLYWLWCGPFESPDRVEVAWREVVTEAGDLRLRRLLESSGPVPWRLKAPVLEQATRRTALHRHVLHALEFAAYDVFGEVDVRSARRLLARLRVAAGAAADLRTRLDELEAASG